MPQKTGRNAIRLQRKALPALYECPQRGAGQEKSWRIIFNITGGQYLNSMEMAKKNQKALDPVSK
jgi:hypothetical protein